MRSLRRGAPSRMRSGSPPILRMASARRMPFHTSSMSAGCTSPATMRLQARPRPNAIALLVRPHHHLERMARAHAGGVRAPRARRAPTSDPRSPSKLPPFGTESMCEPNRIGVQRRRRCRRGARRCCRRDRCAAARPAARISAITKRAARDVGVGVGGAADAVGERAAGGTAECAQRLDPLAQDARRRPAARWARIAGCGVRMAEPRRRCQRTAATPPRNSRREITARWARGLPMRSSLVRS